MHKVSYRDESNNVHIDTTLINLGIGHVESGACHQVFQCYERVLLKYGEDANHADVAKEDVADMLENKGNCHSVFAEHEEALDYLERGLLMRRRIYSEHSEHRKIVVSLLYNLTSLEKAGRDASGTTKCAAS